MWRGKTTETCGSTWWEATWQIDWSSRCLVLGERGPSRSLSRVQMERVKNGKIFGLVDGEVAAVFGGTAELIGCSDLLFQLELSECEGILFLGAHELENVLIGASDFVEFVERNVELGELGSRDREDIRSQVWKDARRFYVAALIKYAWAHLYCEGVCCGVGDVGNFRSNRPLVEEIRQVRERVEGEFPDGGQEFRRRLKEIGRRAKQKMDDVERAGGNIRCEVVRLADGKGLLARLRNRWQLRRANDGLLVERVRLSPFSERFRDELLALTEA